MNNLTTYQSDIRNRSKYKFLLGIIGRLYNYYKYANNRRMARLNGAKIGEGVIIPKSLAKRCNSNLTIGNHVSIQTDKIDLRCRVIIGNNVIIGSETEIITQSHNIDSPNWELKSYGIVIEDYVWIPTKVLILPSCRSIGRGAVIGSGSVVSTNVNEMDVVSGNPAIPIKKRKVLHTDLVIESLLGGDLVEYCKARKI